MSFQQQPMALLTSPINSSYNSSYTYGPSVDSPVSLNAGLIHPVTGDTLTTLRNTTQQDIDQIRQALQILEQQNRDYNVRLAEAKNMIKELMAQVQGQGAQLLGLKQEMYELKKNHDRLRAEYRPKPRPKLNSLIGTRENSLNGSRESFGMNL